MTNRTLVIILSSLIGVSLLVILSVLVSRAAIASRNISADNPRIVYLGRWDDRIATAPSVQWPGAAISLNFRGTSIKVNLGDAGDNHWYAILDDSPTPIDIYTQNGVTQYTVATGLPNTTHKLYLTRTTSAWKSATIFYGLELDTFRGLAKPPARSARRIEFYGDSITEACCMLEYKGIDGTDDNWYGYAAITARNLGAEYTVVALGGIGLINGFTTPRVMPNFYDRWNPDDDTLKWDFSKWVPQVVVLNIGQNDKWTSTANPAENIAAYQSMFLALRDKYPQATIIGALGSMDAVAEFSPWPGYIQSAVDAIGDPKITAFIFPYLTSSSHPNYTDHQLMAKLLTEYINSLGVAWGPGIVNPPQAPKDE